MRRVEMTPELAAAVVTALAGYLAGRSQARAAHKGPLASARRTAQRDAYAQLITAATAFEREIHGVGRLARGEGARGTARKQEVARDIARRCYEISDGEVIKAVNIVALEGPEVLSGRANAIARCTYDLRHHEPTSSEHRPDSNYVHALTRLNKCISRFAEAAREQVNEEI